MDLKANHPANVIKNYPVLVYYLVTFLISWGGLVIMIGGFSGIKSSSTDVPFVPLYLISVAGPSIAGVLLTGLFSGRKGYHDFFSRLFKWRVSIKWYAVAIVVAPVTVFTALFILSFFSPVYIPGIFNGGNNTIASMFGLSNNDTLTMVLFVLMLGLFNGFVEELGWTGFATHTLRLSHSLIATGLNLGLMWGLWHLLSNYVGSAEGAGTFPLPLYIAGLLFTFLPPFRILMVWVYDYTGSLLIAILMHASLDVFWILSMPQDLTGQERVIWYTVWAGILWMIVALIRRFGNNIR
jgi:CAAX protease family protein